jgi:hypothetical protein
MKGRDWPYGYPAFYNATVYAHHKNTDPVQLGFGDVQFAYANPSMKRIELLMRIFNEEARKKGQLNFVERINAGERCDVSMGARIPWDACSICTDWDAVKKAWGTFDPKRHKHPGIAVLEVHKRSPIRGIAVTRNDYCPCLRNQKNQVLPDGRRVFMYNIFPRFFDISCVFIGADRTARVMWHMAPSYREDAPISRPQVAAHNSLASMLDLFKVAELEKEIPGGIMHVLGDAESAAPVRYNLLKGEDPKQILSTAAALGILLSPTEFADLLKVPEFDTACGQVDDSHAVSEDSVVPKLFDALIHMAPLRSSFEPFLEARLKRPATKTAAAQRVVAAGAGQKTAAKYNGYRLSVLEKLGSLVDLAQAEGYWAADPLEAKVAGSGLAALLLGAAPVIHLLASHLRRKQDEGQQLGAMASFIAANPTFTALAVLGAGIRTAMIAENGGLLSSAVKLLGATTKM